MYVRVEVERLLSPYELWVYSCVQGVGTSSPLTCNSCLELRCMYEVVYHGEQLLQVSTSLATVLITMGRRLSSGWLSGCHACPILLEPVSTQ